MSQGLGRILLERGALDAFADGGSASPGLGGRRANPRSQNRPDGGRRHFAFGGEADGDPGEGIGGVDHETQGTGGGNARDGVSPDAGSVDYGSLQGMLDQSSANIHDAMSGGFSDFEGTRDFGGYGNDEFGGPRGSYGGPAGPFHGYDDAEFGGVPSISAEALAGLEGARGGIGMGIDGLGGRSTQGPLGYDDAEFDTAPAPAADFGTANVGSALAGLGLGIASPGFATTASGITVNDEDPTLSGAGFREAVTSHTFPSEGAMTAQSVRAASEQLRDAIRAAETGSVRSDPYGYQGKAVDGKRAQGAYGQMEQYVPDRLDDYLGVTGVGKKGFLKDPQLQDVLALSMIQNAFYNQNKPLTLDYQPVENFAIPTRTPAEIARSWVGNGAIDRGTGIRAADYGPGHVAPNFDGDLGRQAYSQPGAANMPGLGVVAGDAVPTTDFVDPYAPAAPAQPSWQQEVLDDPSTFGPAAGRAPTAFEQHYGKTPQDVPTDYTNASLFDQAPYGMVGKSGLGLDAIGHGSPSRGVQVAGDYVPASLTSEEAPKPEHTKSPLNTGLPQTIDSSILNGAIAASQPTRQGFSVDGTIPNHGVINQPTTAFHEKYAGPLVNAALSTTPLGAPNTIASLLGMIGIGPGSAGGYLASHTVPGMNMSLGNSMVGGENSPWSGSSATKAATATPKSATPQQGVHLDPPQEHIREYRPDKHPETAGYRPEEQLFFADGGFIQAENENDGELATTWEMMGNPKPRSLGGRNYIHRWEQVKSKPKAIARPELPMLGTLVRPANEKADGGKVDAPGRTAYRRGADGARGSKGGALSRTGC